MIPEKNPAIAALTPARGGGGPPLYTQRFLILHTYIINLYEKKMSSLYPGAALIATGLSLHGYRKGSLSLSGAIAAWLVGYGHLANPLKVFGVSMIVFYLIGSRATKVSF